MPSVASAELTRESFFKFFSLLSWSSLRARRNQVTSSKITTSLIAERKVDSNSVSNRINFHNYNNFKFKPEAGRSGARSKRSECVNRAIINVNISSRIVKVACPNALSIRLISGTESGEEFDESFQCHPM